MSRLPVLLLLLPALGCASEPAAPAASVPFTPEFTLGSGVTPSFPPHNSVKDPTTAELPGRGDDCRPLSQTPRIS